MTLTACGSSSKSSSDSSSSGSTSGGKTTTIKFVAADYGANGQNPSQAYWQGVIDAFEKANPTIKVDLQVINWNDINDKLATMLQNKQYPDLVEGPAYGAWAQAGLLYPQDQVISSSVASDILPSLQKGASLNGTAYGIPFVSSTRSFLINNVLWKKAKLPMNGSQAVAPKTWADVETDAKALKAAGVQIPLGLPLGPEEAQAETFMWEMNNGGGFTDSSGKWALNSAADISTFTTLQKWVNEGLTEQDPASLGRTPLEADFASGKVGMMNGHPTQLTDVKKDKLDVTWATLPTATAGATPQTLGVADWMSAFKEGGHAAQIKAFLDFAYQKDNQVKFDDEYALTPVTNSALPQVKDDNPALVPFINALPGAQFVPANNPQWNTVLTDIQHQIGDAIKNPKSGLDALQQAASQAGQ